MKLAIDGSGAVARWVAARLPHVGAAGFGPNAAIAVVSQDETIMAGVVFHDWQELAGTMQLSCAADTPRWATRRIVSALLAYPFVQLAVNKCWTATDHANARCGSSRGSASSRKPSCGTNSAASITRSSVR